MQRECPTLARVIGIVILAGTRTKTPTASFSETTTWLAADLRTMRKVLTADQVADMLS